MIRMLRAWLANLVVWAAGMTAHAQTNASIDAATVQRLLQEGALLIDVRSPAEYAAGHLPMARNVPHDQIAVQLPRLQADKEGVLLLHCRSGRRSHIAAEQLRQLGYRRVINLGSYRQAEALVRGREP